MSRTAFQGLFIVIAAAAAVLVSAGAARAEISFNVEVRETYEDNVIGLVADNPNIAGSTGITGATAAGGDTRGGGGTSGGKGVSQLRRQGGLDENPGTVTTGGTTTTTTAAPAGAARNKGDFSTSINADIGATTDLGGSLSLLFKADVEHTSYQTFKQFDFTIGAVRAGVSHYFTDEILAKALVRVAMKSFDKNQRNSTAFGVTISLKEWVVPSFWLKQVYDFEQNDATSSLNSYQGDSIGLWAGYSLTAKSSVGLGYSALSRKFKEPSSFKVTSNTFSVDWTWDFYDNWSVNAGYDLEKGDSNIPDTATTNNIYSVGLLYSY
jgi:hypothetical protein